MEKLKSVVGETSGEGIKYMKVLTSNKYHYIKSRPNILCQMRDSNLIFLHDVQYAKGWQFDHGKRFKESQQAIIAECQLARLVDEINFLQSLFEITEQDLPELKFPPHVQMTINLGRPEQPKVS